MRMFGLDADFVKTLIKDTIETYSGQWRLVHETIQNSHDAIQLNDGIDRGKITVDLHIGANKVVVTDNGRGIPIDQFPTIFTLGGTVKNDPRLRRLLKGSQGVGLKSTVFTSDFFEVETTYPGGKWSKRVEGCWKYDQPGFNDEVTEPVAEAPTGDLGTRVTYSLHDYSTKDFLEEVVSEYCEELDIDQIDSEKQFLDLMELYFRARTYLGCVQSLLGVGEHLKPIRVTLNLRFDYATLDAHRRGSISRCPFLSGDKYHGRTLRREFPATYAEFLEIHNGLKRADKADSVFEHFSEVIENPPDPNLKKVLIQKLTRDQAELLLSRVRRDLRTGRGQLQTDTDKVQKHRRLLDKTNGCYLVIGPRRYLTKFLRLSPKQQISVNGLPTNIGLEPPRGAGELGYLLNIHFLIDLDTTLGYGKRNIPSVVKGQADAFFADIFGVLRRLGRAIVGERDAIEPRPVVWDKEQEYELYQRADNTFRDLNLPFKLPPVEEQDVICLFHELLGSGGIKGYYPFRTSVDRTYDALMYVSRRPDNQMPATISWRDLKIVEFKVTLSDLIRDFVEEKKFIQDVDLAIVWTDDYEDDTDYVVSSLERDEIAPLPYAQKRVRLRTQSCQVLVLEKILFPENHS